MKTILTLCVVFAFALCGCKKEKSSRWLLADITLLDYDTHEPISFSSELTYYDNLDLGQAYSTTETVNETVQNGNLKIERRITKRSSNYTLSINAPGYTFNPNLNPYSAENIPTAKIKLKEKSKNNHVLYLKRVRYFSLKLFNTNCTGTEDSLWLDFQSDDYGTRLFTGCQDSIYGYGSYSFLLPYQTQNSSIDIMIRSKKNGVVLINNQTFNLQPGNNTVEIDY